ncbi:MAG: peptidylprolyl isomerase [Oscillatoriaceae cyanobacterium]
MLPWRENRASLWARLLKTTLLALLLFNLFTGLSYARESILPAGNAITDAKALLRYALPIDNQKVREIQTSLEDISFQLRGKRWTGVTSDISRASLLLKTQVEEILTDIPEARQTQAQDLLTQMQGQIASLQSAAEAQDKPQTLGARDRLLNSVGQLEELMVKEFPFEVPEPYSNRPLLKGRATVEVTTSAGAVTVIVDGYSAPVTAGNFVDLVQRGFYDGLPFIRSEDFYVLQTGDPPGPDEGFIDPKTGVYRNVPLEVLVRGDEKPIYGSTLEDLGIYFANPVLPFSSYGTVAMARPEAEPDGGSSQFFFFLFEPELTPAGLNLLDGRYAVFGYVVEGAEILGKIKKGDKIISARVVQGAENLVTPAA